jgi:hypothetical protein
LVGRSAVEFTEKIVGADSVLFCFRLNKAITDLNLEQKSVDPVTQFWTVYRKVAEEHDNDMVAKYVGDLDTSLLFVSVFMTASVSYLLKLDPFSCVRRVYFLRSPPRSSPK